LADTVFTVPHSVLSADTLVDSFVPESRGWAWNAVRAEEACLADTVLSVPDSVFGADTLLSFLVPESWGGAGDTVGAEGTGWANALDSSPGSTIRANTFSSDYLSGLRAAVANVTVFIPVVACITGDTLLGGWVPVFGFVASNAELSGGEVAFGAAVLVFVVTEVVSWKVCLIVLDSSDLSYDQEGEYDLSHKICH